MELKIYQVFYLPDDQRPHLDPCCIPFDNSAGKSPFFESEVMRQLIAGNQHLGCDYFGVISWLFKGKIHMPEHSSPYVNIINRIDQQPGADIYSFFTAWPKHRPFNHAGSGHPSGMTRIAQMVVNRMSLGINIQAFKAPTTVYMNFFVAKPSVYEAYVTEFLVPAMAIMSNPDDEELQQMLWTDSKYKSDVMTARERQRMVYLFNRPYYPWHAFICERLFVLWYYINIKKYTLRQIA